MNRLNFLNTILPDEGIYCVVGINKGRPAQSFLDKTSLMDKWADAQIMNSTDAYFSPASFKSSETRSAKNTHRFKSLWVDLDIGSSATYETQGEGIQALKAFCSSLRLPKPTIVSSGYGLHIYWVFSEAVDYNTWKPLAVSLVDKFKTHNLNVKDRGVTTDAARILRIPDTINYKGGEQALVRVLVLSPTTSVEEYKLALQPKQLISPLEQAELAVSNNPLNDTTRALLGNIIYKFSRIMQKSINGNGCAQMLHIYQNQNDIPEPLWRAGLSIAQFCVDKETAIHKISYIHEAYNPAETERKAWLIKGPHLCETFERINPEFCEGCKHKGVISTPLLLGRDILEAQPTDNLITAESEELGVIDIEIPVYPYPYTRGPNGGVYVKSVLDDDGETDKTLVYENDFYVVSRRTDPYDGEAVSYTHLRAHET